jgi:hypothetical protein
VYRNIDNGEWAGLWAAVWQSVQEADIIVINSKDDAGGENTSEEDDAALNFSAFDYWRRSF